MNSKKVLIPVDLVHSPCDALVYAREIAADYPVCVTLLYVLNLNVVLPSREIYEELRAESEAALRRLAGFFFGTDSAVRIVVREGLPHEEIVAEAKEESSDLVILPASKKRSWRHFLCPGTTEKIIDTAPCPTVVLPRNRPVVLPKPADPAAPEPAPERVLLPAA